MQDGCKPVEDGFWSPLEGQSLDGAQLRIKQAHVLGVCLQPHVQKVRCWQLPAETRSRDSQAVHSACQGTPKCHIQLLTLHSVRGGWRVKCEVLSQDKCHSQRSSESEWQREETLVTGVLTEGKRCHCHHLCLGDLLMIAWDVP